MIVINFIREIFSRSKSYQNVWTYLLSKIITNERNEISIFEISGKYKIDKKTIYPILQFGCKYFVENDIGYLFCLEKNQILIIPRSQAEIIDLNPPKTLNTHKLQPSVRTAPKKNKTAIDKKKFKLLIDEIVDYLNEKTFKNFSSDNLEITDEIISRLIEGFTLEQFKYVIDIKTDQWTGTNNERYLRPKTLFSHGNMENYVNESSKVNIIQQTPTTESIYAATEEAKRLNSERYNKAGQNH